MTDPSSRSAFALKGSNRRVFLMVSILWLVICAAYISVYSGWNNLLNTMPHEFFMILLATVFPIIAFGLFIVLSQVASRVDGLKSEVGSLSERDAKAIQALTLIGQTIKEGREDQLARDAKAMEALTTIGQTIREGREAQITAQERAAALLVDATRDSREAIIDELRSQGGLSRDAAKELSLLVQGATPAIGDAAHKIDRMRSLAEILTLALNDLSMTATQLLTDILVAIQDDRETARKFLATLTDAYFAGDKNVFFRSLALEARTHTGKVRDLAAESEVVRRRISKIIREAAEIKSLVAQCNPNDLIRIVFEDGDLWDLENLLSSQFADDGSLKD